MLKAYNDNKNNDYNNNDNNNNKFRWEKLKWANKKIDWPDWYTHRWTDKDRQTPSTYTVVHKHQRTL